MCVLPSYRCKGYLRRATKAGEGSLAYGRRGQSIMAVESMGREPEAAAHAVVTVGNQSQVGGNALCLLLPPFLLSLVPQSTGWCYAHSGYTLPPLLSLFVKSLPDLPRGVSPR